MAVRARENQWFSGKIWPALFWLQGQGKQALRGFLKAEIAT